MIALDTAVAAETRTSACDSEFSEFYLRTAPKLAMFIRRQIGDPELAADLAQDSYISLLRASLPEMNEAQLKGYLYRTATSLITDHWRKNQRWRRFTQWFSKPEFVKAPELSDVERAFRELKERDRTLLWLAYVEGLTHEELAHALSLRTKSMKVILHRTRERFAASLKKYGLDPEVVR